MVESADAASFVPSVGGGLAPHDVIELRPLLLVLALFSYLADLFVRRRAGSAA